MSNPPLIGIMGAAGAGKDECADYLRRYALPGNFGFSGVVRKRAFAKPLYDMVEALLIDLKVEPRWDNREWKETPLEALDVSPRHLLQSLGTEWGRGLRPDFWLVPMTAARTRFAEMNQGMVVPDVRFPDEADWVLENGGVLLFVNRPAVKKVRKHVSEELKPWKGRPHSLIGNTGDLPLLYEQLDRFVEQHYG